MNIASSYTMAVVSVCACTNILETIIILIIILPITLYYRNIYYYTIPNRTYTCIMMKFLFSKKIGVNF